MRVAVVVSDVLAVQVSEELRLLVVEVVENDSVSVGDAKPPGSVVDVSRALVSSDLDSPIPIFRIVECDWLINRNAAVLIEISQPTVVDFVPNDSQGVRMVSVDSTATAMSNFIVVYINVVRIIDRDSR